MLLAMVFVPSFDIGLLHVGQVVTFTLQFLHVMCPTGHAGMGTSLGTRRHTGHWSSSETWETEVILSIVLLQLIKFLKLLSLGKNNGTVSEDKVENDRKLDCQ